MTMKRFAFLAARPSTAADIREDEWDAVKRFGNLSDDDMVYFSLEDRPHIDPTEYAGIFVSGSQYGFVDEHDIKTPEQIATEEVLFAVNDIVLEHDIPYLGLCYGHQSLAVSLNEELTGDYFEELTTVHIEVTEEGKKDPILGASQTPSRRFWVTPSQSASCLVTRWCWRRRRTVPCRRSGIATTFMAFSSTPKSMWNPWRFASITTTAANISRRVSLMWFALAHRASIIRQQRTLSAVSLTRTVIAQPKAHHEIRKIATIDSRHRMGTPAY